MIDEICREIIKELGARFFVETGTDMAETVAQVSRWFAEIDPNFGRISDYVSAGARAYDLGSTPIKYPVFENVGDSEYNLFSVDIDRHSLENARELFKTNGNIHLFHEDSAEFLKRSIDENLFKNSETMFFLDAHWGNYWPLRDELKQIRRLDKFIVAIDDFFVPRRSNRGRPHADFGFDFYRGRILCWGYVRDLLDTLDIKVYYPTRSNRDSRGFVVFFAGYQSEELDFLKGMPLEYVDKDHPIHKDPVPSSLLTYLDFRNLVRSVMPFRY